MKFGEGLTTVQKAQSSTRREREVWVVHLSYTGKGALHVVSLSFPLFFLIYLHVVSSYLSRSNLCLVCHSEEGKRPSPRRGSSFGEVIRKAHPTVIKG